MRIGSVVKSGRAHTIYISEAELETLRAERGATRCLPRRYEVHVIDREREETRSRFGPGGILRGARRGGGAR